MMSTTIFLGKPILSLLTPLFAARALSKGRRVLRTKKNPVYSKRLGRIINFLPHVLYDCAQLIRIERDPLRTSFIGLFRFLRSGFLSYMLIPAGMLVGDFCAINYGCNLQLISQEKLFNFKNLKLNNLIFSIKPLGLFIKGSVVHNVEQNPFRGFKLCRAAGSSAILEAVSVKLGLVKLLLPSGKVSYLPLSSYASAGVVSNEQCKNVLFRKAGQFVWKGTRPLTRGVAMNPVDHPHGGGEGKTSGGRPSVSFSAILAKGYKTSKSKLKKKFNLLKRKFIIFS